MSESLNDHRETPAGKHSPTLPPFPFGRISRFLLFFPPTRSAALEVDFLITVSGAEVQRHLFFSPSGREIYNLLIKKKRCELAASRRHGDASDLAACHTTLKYARGLTIKDQSVQKQTKQVKTNTYSTCVCVCVFLKATCVFAVVSTLLR